MAKRGAKQSPEPVPPPLHELESEVMEELWRSGESSVRSVMGALNKPGREDRADRPDYRHLRADTRESERAHSVTVAVPADQIPAAVIGDHPPRLDGADAVRLDSRRPVLKLHGLPGIDGAQQDWQHRFGAPDARQG